MEQILTFLRQNLSHEVYEAMVAEFGRRKFGRLVNGTDQSWNLRGVVAVAKYIEKAPSEVIEEFQLNIDIVSYGDVRKLDHAEGKTIEFATHVA